MPVGPMDSLTLLLLCHARGICHGTVKVRDVWVFGHTQYFRHAHARSLKMPCREGQLPMTGLLSKSQRSVSVCVCVVQHGVVYQECDVNGQWVTTYNTSECDSHEQAPHLVRIVFFYSIWSESIRYSWEKLKNKEFLSNFTINKK